LDPANGGLKKELDAGGYVPIGFFQLWNARSRRLIYPEHHATAARSDMLFSLQWARQQRQLLPEIVGRFGVGRVRIKAGTARFSINDQFRRRFCDDRSAKARCVFSFCLLVDRLAGRRLRQRGGGLPR
jgi:hypothetical protein